MKLLKYFLLVVGLTLVVNHKIYANEGVVNLSSQTADQASCFAASVYVDGRYKILMTCRGLRMAIDPVKNKYVSWIVNGENKRRLGEIVGGKMQASTDESFEAIVVTAEKNAQANKSEEMILLSGKVEAINFSLPAELVKIEEVSAPVDETEVEKESIKVTPTPKVEEEATGTFKSAAKAFLYGFGLLLLIVGVLSYVSRRKGVK